MAEDSPYNISTIHIAHSQNTADSDYPCSRNVEWHRTSSFQSVHSGVPGVPQYPNVLRTDCKEF